MPTYTGDVKEYARGFISAFIGLSIALSLVPSILQTVANFTGVPILAVGIVGSVVGAGILLFIMDNFL